MKEEHLQTGGGAACGYTLPLGGVNLVIVQADKGVVCCAAVDVHLLDKFGVAGASLSGVSSVEDILNGAVQTVNQTAEVLGIKPGLSGREALERMT